MARLNIEHLIEHQSLTDVLGTFSRLPRYVNEYYDGVMQSIANNADAETALTTLSIAAAALKDSRPLTCDELNGALKRQLIDAQEELNLTKDNIGILTNGLLINYEFEGQQAIQPCHVDVPTYLNEECDDWLTNTADMAMLCITRVREFLQQDKDETARAILKDYLQDAFLRYAWEYWGHHHANHSSVDADKVALALLSDLDSSSVVMNRALYLIRITSADHDGRYFDRPYGTSLHICAHFGLVGLAREYLEGNYSSKDSRLNVLDSPDPITGATPVMVAVEHEKLEFVQFLLDEGVMPEQHDYFDHSPLSKAMIRIAYKQNHYGDTSILEEIIDLLLATLTDEIVNTHMMGNQTLLMLAIEHKQEAVIQRLLLHACLDLKVVDSRGRNLLHVAADNAYYEILPVIAAKHKQALEELVNRPDDSGRSALVAVVQQSNEDLQATQPALRLLSSCGADFAATDDRGYTALHHAVSGWAPASVIEVLLDCSVPVDAQDCDGRTALHLASAADNKSLVDILLDRGADLTCEDCNGLTALGSAQRRRSSTVLEQLSATSPTEQEYDIDDEEFSTLPLWQQVRRDSTAFSELFAYVGSPAAAEAKFEPDPFGQTALHWAVQRVDYDATRLLLEDTRLDANSKDATGTTALQMAVNKLLLEETNVEEHLKAIDELFLPNNRVNNEMTNAAGLTILQQAMESIEEREESLELALLLITHNVFLGLPRYQLQLLYEKAVARGRHDVLNALIAAGAHPLQCRLPFHTTHEEDEDENCVQMAHKLGDQALIAVL